MLRFTCNCFILLAIAICRNSRGQYDYCLRASGCSGDECCHNIVAKTGPICDKIPGCASEFPVDCCRNARPVYTDYGIFYGYAILLDDPYGYRDNGRRYLEVWKGIPYARPPTKENNLRFRKPVIRPYSRAKYDATYIRDACAQPVEKAERPLETRFESPYEWMRRINFHTAHQLEYSEDCLYMNIFVLNETDPGGGSPYSSTRRKLPILVFMDSVDHLIGSTGHYPGHALAQLGMVVIFVNHRLGPFGFLAGNSRPNDTDGIFTSDDLAFGNYGLWDQVHALEFIREIAPKFSGDAEKITLCGVGTGAADVALHMLSRHSGRRQPPLFHGAIMISGSDQMEGGFVRRTEEASLYSTELARQVGCDTSSERHMLACLRSRSTIELAQAGLKTRLHRPGWLTKPWSPTLDGDFLEDWPENLWKSGHFAHIPLIGGLTVDASALYALSSLFRLRLSGRIFRDLFRSTLGVLKPNPKFSGITEEVMREAFAQMAQKDFAMDTAAVADSLVLDYTDWSNATCARRRWSSFRGAWTDRLVGSGLTQTLDYHSAFSRNQTHMYAFAYRSTADPWTSLLGSYGGSELQYIFGLPRLMGKKSLEELEREWPENLGLSPPNWLYVNPDINMTDYMLYLVANFVKHGNATPNAVRNLTWDTYRPDNRTYLWLNLTKEYTFSRSHMPQLEELGLGAGFDLRQNYRVDRSAFWRRLYPIRLTWVPRFPIEIPLPDYIIDYQTVALILTGSLTLLIIINLSLSILYVRKQKMLN